MAGYARALIVVAVILGAFTLLPSHAGAEEIELAPGRSAFWDGEDVLIWNGTQAACNVPMTPCKEYGFGVRPGGKRLRVGFDLELDDRVRSDETRKSFEIRLYSPEGDLVETKSTGVIQTIYSAEFLVCFVDRCEGTPYARSPAGTWRLQVIPVSVTEWSYRMRAKLERSLPRRSSKPSLPNLQAAPPFEFTFTAPAHFYGPALGVGTFGPLSCSPFDDPDDTLTRCLRFSAGPENVGPGTLELFGHAWNGRAEPVRAFQRIYSGDGEIVRDRRAGRFEWHESHGHWHYLGYLTYELFRVEARGEPLKAKRTDVKLVPVSEGRKVGVCPVDERIASWRRFDQDAFGSMRRTSSVGGSCGSAATPNMGLSAGWGDYYEWQRYEQYVPFPTDAAGLNVDGYYLLRVTTDEDNLILETNERDNSSYGLIEVRGFDVKLLDHGHGRHPW